MARTATATALTALPDECRIMGGIRCINIIQNDTTIHVKKRIRPIDSSWFWIQTWVACCLWFSYCRLGSSFQFPHQPAIRNLSLRVSKSSVQKALDIVQEDSQLPIFDILLDARSSLICKPNLVLEAPPGAGKTTILPLAFLTETWTKIEDDSATTKDCITNNIWVIEPRRVAARSAATRMASILKEAVGQTVGYAVRGDSKISAKKTRITVVTDGVLLNRLRDDPELTGINAILFDEFHERGVGSDTALALAVEIQRSLRPELRLVVMSATLFHEFKDNRLSDEEESIDEGSKLTNILGGKDHCRTLVSRGRQYPIDIQWARKGYLPLGVILRSRIDLVATICDSIEEALIIAPAKGDVLAFLPGVREIQLVVQELTKTRRVNAEVLPLYGTLPKKSQDYAIFPHPQSQQRVIVSSPISESSLTLERVTCVVDSGLRREARCDVDTGLPRLITTRCSKASARQRAGRAGRVQDGLCLRLYTESEYEKRFLEHAPPEVLNTDLMPTLLLLSDWGCSQPADIYDIPFVDLPDSSALDKAYETLVLLKALEKISDGRYVLTELGRSIAKLPTHPRLATTIVRAKKRQQLAASVICSSFLDDDAGGRGIRESDLRTSIRNLLENSLESFAVKNVLQYAKRISDEAHDAVAFFLENPSDAGILLDKIGETLLPGFIDLVAERKSDASYGGSLYMLSLGRTARLDDIRNSPDYVVVVNTSTSDDGITRIRSFASIEETALYRVARQEVVAFAVPSSGYEVRARRSLMIGSLELSSTPLSSPSAEEVTKILMNAIRSLGGIHSAFVQNMPKKNFAELDGLRHRVRLAISLCSDYKWPTCFASIDALEFGTATLLDINVTETLVEPWLAAAGSLKGVDILEVLKGTLSSDHNAMLNQCCPLLIEAPDGTQIPILYNGGMPTAKAKLQQFFGTTESPCVGPPSNKSPISLSLLSPAGKELARTINLPFFWKETYPAVRSEMRGRYPKHPWPEDPMNAAPTRQTKKQQHLVVAGVDSENNSLNSKNKGGNRRKKKRRKR